MRQLNYLYNLIAKIVHSASCQKSMEIKTLMSSDRIPIYGGILVSEVIASLMLIKGTLFFRKLLCLGLFTLQMLEMIAIVELFSFNAVRFFGKIC